LRQRLLRAVVLLQERKALDQRHPRLVLHLLEVPAHARGQPLRPVVVGERELHDGRARVGLRRWREQIEGGLHLGLDLRLQLGGAGIVRVLLRDATRLIGEGIRPLDLDARQRRGCFRKARPGSPAISSTSAAGGASAGASAAGLSASPAEGGGGMPSIAEGSSSAGSGDAGGSASAAGSGVGTAAAGAAWILGCGASNIIVDRAASAALAAGFGPRAGTGGGTAFAGDSPN